MKKSIQMKVQISQLSNKKHLQSLKIYTQNKMLIIGQNRFVKFTKYLIDLTNFLVESNTYLEYIKSN